MPLMPFSGNAPGPGPTRAIFREITRIFFDENGYYWTTLDDDGLSTPKLLELAESDDEDSGVEDGSRRPDGNQLLIRFFRTFGLFWRLCLLWEMDCLRFSPMFAIYVLTHNKDLALDDPTLSVISPSLHARIQHAQWPPLRLPDGQWQVVVGRDPYLMILSFNPECEVCSHRVVYEYVLSIDWLYRSRLILRPCLNAKSNPSDVISNQA